MLQIDCDSPITRRWINSKLLTHWHAYDRLYIETAVQKSTWRVTEGRLSGTREAPSSNRDYQKTHSSEAVRTECSRRDATLHGRSRYKRRDVSRGYIMVAPARKEGGWKREGETGCSQRGAARDEREMTGINGRYADTRNSIGHKRS